jgi:hypothetical protein
MAEKLIPNKIYNAVILVFIVLHGLIIYIGLFVDASISNFVVSPVNDNTMIAP